jgi:hypothetical protein
LVSSNFEICTKTTVVQPKTGWPVGQAGFQFEQIQKSNFKQKNHHFISYRRYYDLKPNKKKK